MSEASDAPSSPYDSLCLLSNRTRVVSVADPADVLKTVPKWSPQQLMMPEAQRGYPELGYSHEIRPGAKVVGFEIRRLTANERDRCELMLTAVVAPALYEERPPVRGEPGRKVRIGFDDEDPEYLRELKAKEQDQRALIVLMGVTGLSESVPGDDEPQKIQGLREKLDDKIIRYLAAEIWNQTYAAGDPYDFFTNANSEATQS